MIDVEALTWPASKLGFAMEFLARRSGLSPRDVEVPATPRELRIDDFPALDQWLGECALWMGVETESVEIPYNRLHQLLKGGGPALFKIKFKDTLRFLALKNTKRGKMEILCPDMMVHQVDMDQIEALIFGEEMEAHQTELQSILHVADISEEHRAEAWRLLIEKRIGRTLYRGCWLLRLANDAPLKQHMLRSGALSQFVALILFYTLSHILFVAGWWVILDAVLGGRLDQSTLLAWAMILLSIVPCRMLVNWLQGLVSVGLGAVFKQRLLAGILRLESHEIRGRGSGQLLGLVLEARRVEALSLSAGFSALFSIIELIVAFGILWHSSVPWMAWLLAAWLIPVGIFFRMFYNNWERYTDLRVRMTNDWVERMSGHKTRLAQEARGSWHKAEDWISARYLRLSMHMDQVGFLLMGVSSRGWLILGCMGLMPAWIKTGHSQEALALALGGVLLAYRAFYKQRLGFFRLIGALLALKRIGPLVAAAARPRMVSPPTYGLTPEAVTENLGTNKILLETQDLVFKFHERIKAAVYGCNLRIRDGERILIEGLSGGGKSTFASVLLGLRTPQSGLILCHGLDRRTLGEKGWRQRVSGAPQFHVNHIFAGTLAFNLLMGSRWPPRQSDLEEAEEICRELGLGKLLDQMPAGMMQVMGEYGWQLSHGEMSRVYIARALLQHTDVLIFDESFGTLDPESLQITMKCVFKRAKTIIVIAHP